jgi:16S rRNA G966 N2-methylase RsmD
MMGTNSGVSIFDPVLSEVIFSWFIPEDGGSVLDPFAGSLARGGVAAVLGYRYTGIEIRKEQIEVNERGLQELGEEIAKRAKYILGDANDIKKLVPDDEKFDLIFTSPPYYDLEVYSDKAADLSAKPSYKEFMEGYERIFTHAAEHLKPNRFIVLEIGDIRDEQGFYRNFIGDNVAMFGRLGFKLYNEIIYAQMLATAPHRAERNMRTRKVVKTHQNIMTFYKGDPSLLKNPQTLEVHRKVLAFFRGEVDEIKKDFKTPTPIQHDIVGKLKGEREGIIEQDE